jgi:hypothetical protein
MEVKGALYDLLGESFYAIILKLKKKTYEEENEDKQEMNSHTWKKKIERKRKRKVGLWNELKIWYRGTPFSI